MQLRLSAYAVAGKSVFVSFAIALNHYCLDRALVCCYLMKEMLRSRSKHIS